MNPYAGERIRAVYAINLEEQQLAAQVYEKKNTKEGEELYERLEEMLRRNGHSEEILFDLAADFYWDYPWKAVEE